MKWHLLGIIAARIVLAGALVFSLLADHQGLRAENEEPSAEQYGPVSSDMIERLRELETTPAQAEPQPRTVPKSLMAVDPLAALANFSCFLTDYGTIHPISRPGLNTLALASREPGSSVLEIYYNPAWMNRFQQPTRLFWLEHECAHHRLGHTQSRTEKSLACIALEEDAADCAAIVTMGNPNQRTVDANGFVAIESDVSRLPGGDGVHRVGSERVQLLRLCLREPNQANQIINGGC